MATLIKLGVTASLLLTAPMAMPQTAPKFPSKVSTVTARLFYSATGTFSDNILDKPDLALWNTIIGEGESGGPSDATLITVEIDGDGSPNATHKEVLSITTQMQGKAPIKRRAGIMLFSGTGKHFQGVWLRDTGCLPVDITVQLDIQPAIKKKINFECGE